MFDISKYIKPGLENTLTFKNGTNLTHQGESVRVYTNTVIDRFFLGDFSSASYLITVSYGFDKKEVIELLVAARVNSASISITGRSRLDDEIITLSGAVNNSYFELTASIADPAYSGAQLIFFANYAETFGNIGIGPVSGSITDPAAYTSTSNVKFLPTLSNTGFKSPNFEVNTAGLLTVDSIDVTTLTVNGGSVLSAASTSLPNTVVTSSLTSLGILSSLDLNGDLTVRSGSTNYITVVSGQITINNRGSTFGTVDGVNIGSTRAGSGNFTSLTSDNQTFISGTGNIDGIVIGNTTPADGTFNTLVSDTITAPAGNIDTVTATTISVDSIALNNAPTLPTHATRKDYVDSRATALAIALGS